MTMQDMNSKIWPIAAINPQASAAATINGAGIDRMSTGTEQAFDSAALIVSSGALTGGPATQTVDAALQDSADNSAWSANLAGTSITQITAINTTSRLGINLRPLRRYVRVSVVVAFTGGAAPTIAVAAMLILGGAHKIPVNSLTT